MHAKIKNLFKTPIKSKHILVIQLYSFNSEPSIKALLYISGLELNIMSTADFFRELLSIISLYYWGEKLQIINPFLS
jgi:hypothetical protein